MQLLKKDPLNLFFLLLILFGIPLNLLQNRYYDNSWTIGEWLISYAGGFVRRGLPGSLIYGVSASFSVNPVYIAWALSIISYLVLFAMIWATCRNKISTQLLLSPVILLAPIIGNYFVRKDTFVLACYGLTLLVIGSFAKRAERVTASGLVAINFLSILAILAHESFGFFGLPSMIFLLYLNNASRLVESGDTFRLSLISLSPSLLAFLASLMFKGSMSHAFSIHNSWQALANVLTTHGALSADTPVGAIDAIGWSTLRGLGLSLSTLNDFSFIIWIPAAWVITIYVCAGLFAGSALGESAISKQAIVFSQFLVISPLFVLGWDFGRWIFIWMASSALLHGFMSSCFPEFREKPARLLGYEDLCRRIVPQLRLTNWKKYLLLFVGIPVCCWSIKGFFLSMPLFCSLKLVERILTAIPKVLAFAG